MDPFDFLNSTVSKRMRKDEDNKRLIKGKTNRASPGGPVHV